MGYEEITEKIKLTISTLIWRVHARIEAEADDISESMLEDALQNDILVIESYPDDPYGESALILTHVNKRPIHVVLSPRKGMCYLITAYRPDSRKWDGTYTRRLKQ